MSYNPNNNTPLAHRNSDLPLVPQAPVQVKTFADYHDFNVRRIVATQPLEKQVETKKNGVPTGKKITNFEIPLQYNYTPEGSDAKVIGNFQYEFPVLESKGGIIAQVQEDGRIDYRIVARLPRNGGPEIQKVRNDMEEIYRACALIFEANNVAVGRPKFTAAAAEAAEFRHIIFTRTDKAGNVIEGADQTISMKLFKYGGMGGRTLFTGMNKKPITDWRMLMSVELKFVPLEEFQCIFIGSKLLIRHKMISAIVKSFKPINSINKQISTLDKLADEEAIAAYEADQARILNERKDMLSIPEEKYNYAQGQTTDEKEKDKETEQQPRNPFPSIVPQQQFQQPPPQQYQYPPQQQYQYQQQPPPPQQYQYPPQQQYEQYQQPPQQSSQQFQTLGQITAPPSLGRLPVLSSNANSSLPQFPQTPAPK